ncbi:MAG TPA: dienelactone hydrolase family protein [Anaerolineales bacterium]|jgi:predicted peptidase|nr:dienelactone hydrolase family protein [Anaerolineales bacterium]HQX17319.1 dienelactone hydrolase family protein [Anaerolineales bacterium]
MKNNHSIKRQTANTVTRLVLLSLIFTLAAGCGSPSPNAAVPSSTQPPSPANTAAPSPAQPVTPTTVATATLANVEATSLPSNILTGQHPFTSQSGNRHSLLFLPSNYGKDPAQKWPLILFLHGSGTSSSNTDTLLFEALPQILGFTPDFPFIVLSPQLTGKPGDEYWFQDKVEESVFSLLDEATAAYAVDTTRIYLTGVSIGGNGVWEYGLSHPERFAALVPVMGFVGDTTGFHVPADICDLKDKPIWAFHGAIDTIVPLEAEQSLVDALKACNGNIQFTVYPDGDHDISGKVYQDQELYAWMLAQSLK